MESVVMPSLKFAKKLRVRLAELKKRRPIEVKNFVAAVEGWKGVMSAWVEQNGAARVHETTRRELKECSGRYNKQGFSADRFFKGAPHPPTMPEQTKKQMSAIQAQLRMLAITGQKTVRVSENEIKKFFTDEDLD